MAKNTRRKLAAILAADVVGYSRLMGAVLEALLDKYQDDGVIDLDNPNVLRIAPFAQIGTAVQLVKEFGSRADFEAAVHELQSEIYSEAV